MTHGTERRGSNAGENEGMMMERATDAGRTARSAQRRRWGAAALVGLALLVCAAAALLLIGRRPLRGLDAAQVAFATVRLSPPDRETEAPDLERLVALLREVRNYRADQTFDEYAGQGAIFHLTMTDGTQREIVAFSPFLVIDGVGYRAAHAPCEALNRYANELLAS